jgi:hypothetical protein
MNEANIFPVEPWHAPYGFLVSGSEQLDTQGPIRVHVEIFPKAPAFERNQMEAAISVFFGLPKNLTLNTIDEVVVGFQLPYWVVLESRSISAEGTEVSVSIVDEELIVLEETGKDGVKVATSIFYAKFNPLRDFDSQRYMLHFGFYWEKSLHRDSYSSFTLTFPVAISNVSARNTVYENCPTACVYIGDSFSLHIETHLPWDVSVKSASHPTLSLAEIGRPTRPVVLEPSITDKWREVDFPYTEVIMLELEHTGLSGQRDRLLYDSGLYVGLGVGLLISGIHEALKAGELRKTPHSP